MSRRAPLPLALLVLSARPAASAVLTAASLFTCPTSAVVSTNCYCTSGCSINSEFSYLWTSPVYPPASTNLGGGAPLLHVWTPRTRVCC